MIFYASIGCKLLHKLINIKIINIAITRAIELIYFRFYKCTIPVIQVNKEKVVIHIRRKVIS